MIIRPIRFTVQDGHIPYTPRLMIFEGDRYVADTGLLYDDDPKKIAEGMIATARRLYKFTDEEILTIKPEKIYPFE